MSLALLLCLTDAFAGEPLVPRWDTGTTRTLKIDLFSYAPGIHPWGSDWKVTMLEQWTAVLECRPMAARIEVCTFPQGVWWGFVLEGTTEFKAINLGTPGTIEITWTPRGRIASWDVQGDEREAFWNVVADTMLQHTFHRPDVIYKPDSKRQIGQEVAGDLTRSFAAALEWELPKKGDPNVSWRVSAAPWSMRRWVQGTASEQVTVRIESEDAQGVHLDISGRVNQVLPSDETIHTMSVETKIMGKATFDRTKGQIVSAWTETIEASTQPLTGHTHHTALVSSWKPGDPVAPADLPTPLLAP